MGGLIFRSARPAALQEPPEGTAASQSAPDAEPARQDKPPGTIDWRKLASRFATELGPAVIFALSLQVATLSVATIIFVTATAVVTMLSWRGHRRIPYIPTGLLILTAALGLMTVWMGDAAFIQFQATAVNAGAALALSAGLATGHLVLKKALQDGFRLTDSAWRRLSIRTIVYLAALAILNEFLRRTLPTETWAWFKAAMPLINVLFLAANWPLIRNGLMPQSGRSKHTAAE